MTIPKVALSKTMTGHNSCHMPGRSCLFALALAWLIFLPITAVHAQTAVPRYEPSDCPVQLLDNLPVGCGTLIVPADYKQPQGPTINLPVIIIQSRNPNPASDPLLYTEGGPGHTSLNAVWWLAGSAFLDDRDIIVLEQRGNLYAQPDLACDISVLWEEAPGHTSCLDSLKEKDIDLTQYTTKSIAADIKALRQALGYEQWNLYGTSYSTRLMQLVMSTDTDGIRSVILQSVSPLDDTRYEHDPEHSARAIEVMLADCAADPGCAAAYPHLETDLYALVQELNAHPLPFEFEDSESGELTTVTVDGRRLLNWMVGDAFYGPAYPPHKTAFLPLLIDQVSQGNMDLLYPWLREELSSQFSMGFAWGLYFAVNCQDDAPGITADFMAQQTAVYPQLDGYIRHAEELAICRAWDLPPAAPLAGEPFRSDIPVLILAGSYDPITPPQWGKEVAENLNNSLFYEFPSSGHNVGTDNPCADSIKVSFLNDPTAVPDTGCLAVLPTPSFILPGEIAIAPGVYHIIGDIDMGNPQRGKRALEIMAAVSLIIFLVEIGYLLVRTAVWLALRSQERTKPDLLSRIGHPLAGITAVIAWFSMLSISNINNYVLNTSPITNYFGFPSDYPPVQTLGILILLFAFFTIILLPIAFLAWKRRYWSFPERLLFNLVSLAALFYTALLVHWDLHLLLF